MIFFIKNWSILSNFHQIWLDWSPFHDQSSIFMKKYFAHETGLESCCDLHSTTEMTRKETPQLCFSSFFLINSVVERRSQQLSKPVSWAKYFYINIEFWSWNGLQSGQIWWKLIRIAAFFMKNSMVSIKIDLGRIFFTWFLGFPSIKWTGPH